MNIKRKSRILEKLAVKFPLETTSARELIAQQIRQGAKYIQSGKMTPQQIVASDKAFAAKHLQNFGGVDVTHKIRDGRKVLLERGESTPTESLSAVKSGIRHLLPRSK